MAIEAVAKNPSVRVMMMEEPEINLHTNLQISVGEYLAKLDKKLFITSHSEWIPLAMAYHLANKLKVYEIVDGNVYERKVDEDGSVDEFVTINPSRDEFLNKFIERILGKKNANKQF